MARRENIPHALVRKIGMCHTNVMANITRSVYSVESLLSSNVLHSEAKNVLP